MEIIRLPVGRAAEAASDCVRIQELEDGRFRLEGSVLLRCGDSDAAESVSLIDGGRYSSEAEAEAAGLAWADEHCPEVLYLSRSDGTRPLPDMEGDASERS